jgi:hypothetical protein
MFSLLNLMAITDIQMIKANNMIAISMFTPHLKGY